MLDVTFGLYGYISSSESHSSSSEHGMSRITGITDIFRKYYAYCVKHTFVVICIILGTMVTPAHYSAKDGQRVQSAAIVPNSKV